ncbi:F-box and leucine-rich repeat protein 4 [Rhizophlyctis rosea]|nr:F-box and leucine-rich repeat protein 4 [Rhizophlyctis rosea]
MSYPQNPQYPPSYATSPYNSNQTQISYVDPNKPVSYAPPMGAPGNQLPTPEFYAIEDGGATPAGAAAYSGSVSKKDRRGGGCCGFAKRTVIVVAVLIAVIVIGAIAGVAGYFLTKNKHNSAGNSNGNGNTNSGGNSSGGNSNGNSNGNNVNTSGPISTQNTLGPQIFPILSSLPSPIPIPSASKPYRSWGPEQLLGAPNTQTYGDQSTAYAPASFKSTPYYEWLLLDYTTAVHPSRIDIYESYNPGYVTEVWLASTSGSWYLVYKGDPTLNLPLSIRNNKITPPDGALDSNFQTSRVLIVVDNRTPPAWTEFDAVGLVDSSGNTAWAASAAARSSYAGGNYFT